jgi:hypothetical protein
MPGAPNRPVPTDGTTQPPTVDPSEAKVLRRLAPMRVALRSETYRTGPAKELTDPLEKAETAFASKDIPTTETHLDRLAVRLAEPRWPSLPEAYRILAVKVIVPTPPQWDPDFSLPPEEKELRRARREKVAQLALAKACLEGEKRRGTPTDDLVGSLAAAEAALAPGGDESLFWGPIDSIWLSLHDRVPLPTVKGAAPRPPPTGS